MSEEISCEKKLVEAYLSEHNLEDTLNKAINQVVRDRPENPFLVLSDLIKTESSAKGILHVESKQTIDSLGSPTVLISLTTDSGVFEASVSSRIPGIYDSPMDKNEDETKYDKFNGKSFNTITSQVHDLLQHKLENMDPTNQDEIDRILEGMEEKLGRNIVLAASMAVCKAGAKHRDTEVYEYISQLADIPIETVCIPIPLISLINGGIYGSNKIYIQDIFCFCTNTTTYEETFHALLELKTCLREQLTLKGPGNTNSGTYGGFAPPLLSQDEIFEVIKEAIKQTSEKLNAPHITWHLGVDIAASEFLIEQEETEEDTNNEYNIDKWVDNSKGLKKTCDDLLLIYGDWKRDFKVTTFIDPFSYQDMKAYENLNTRENDIQDDEEIEIPTLGGDKKCRVQIVGHNLLKHGISSIHDAHACNTLFFQLGHYSTISQTIKGLLEARSLGLSTILGCPHGTTNDHFIMDLAIGLNAGQIKVGGFMNGDSMTMYNYLLQLSTTSYSPAFVGMEFRK